MASDLRGRTGGWRRAALTCLIPAVTAACGSTVAVQHQVMLQVPSGRYDAANASSASSAEGAPDAAVTPLAVDQGAGSGASGGSAPSGSAGSGATGAQLERLVTRYGPGITDTTINVGFIVTTNGDQANAAAGAAGISTGDERRNDQILVDDLNARGGVAGRKVVPIFHEVDATTTQTTDQLVAAACADFTQDHKTFAVFTGTSLLPCLDNAKAVAIHDDFGASNEDVFRTHPYYAEVSLLNLNRLARAQIAGLLAGDWLNPWNSTTGQPGGAGTRLGIVSVDEPSFRQAVDVDLVRGFQRKGLTPLTYFVHNPHSNAELGQTSGDMANAILKFRQQGVEHVIVFDAGGTLTLLFLNAARSQRYLPRYGMNSQNAAQLFLTAGDIDGNQLAGMQGVGFMPSADVTEADNSDDGPYSNPARRHCLAVFRAKGITFADGNAKAVALLQCNQVSFLKASVDRGMPYTPGTLDRTTFLAGLNHLGTSFVSTMTFGTSFGPNRHDGAQSVRLIAYNRTCGCVRYASGLRAAW